MDLLSEPSWSWTCYTKQNIKGGPRYEHQASTKTHSLIFFLAALHCLGISVLQPGLFLEQSIDGTVGNSMTSAYKAEVTLWFVYPAVSFVPR